MDCLRLLRSRYSPLVSLRLGLLPPTECCGAWDIALRDVPADVLIGSRLCEVEEGDRWYTELWVGRERANLVSLP